MKVLDATGRFIASPLGAVLFSRRGRLRHLVRRGATQRGRSKGESAGEQGTGRLPSRAVVWCTRPGYRRASRVRRGPAVAGCARRDRGEAAVGCQIEKDDRRAGRRSRGDPRHGRVGGILDGGRCRGPSGAAVCDGRGRIDRGCDRARRSEGEGARGIPGEEGRGHQGRRRAEEAVLWCDEHGLWDAAKSHWGAILRLEPENEAARRRLGFRSRDRHWVLDAASPKTWRGRRPMPTGRCWRSITRRCDAGARAPCPPGARRSPISKPWAIRRRAGDLEGLRGGLRTPRADRLGAGPLQDLGCLADAGRPGRLQPGRQGPGRGRRGAARARGGRVRRETRRPDASPDARRERQVPVPGRAPARELLVEGDTANYRFLFSQVEAPSPESLAGFFQPRLSAGEIQFARQFNENQSAMARDGLDRQVEMAKQMIEKYNDAIRALNARVARVLNEAGGAGIRPEPEAGRRWLAMALGTEYTPAPTAPNRRSPRSSRRSTVRRSYRPRCRADGAE